MRERPYRSVHGRAIIGVIALYALVLQALLTVLAPALPRLDGSLLCAEHLGSGIPAEEGQTCGHHACCIQVQAADLPSPSRADSSPALWPPASVPLARPSAAAIQPRAPPDQGISPRGPPTV